MTQCATCGTASLTAAPRTVAPLEPAMTDRDLEHRLLIACAVAREAGHLAADYFARREQLEVEHKGVQDLVSVADREVEELIRTRLGTAFPEDALLGEEGGGDGLAGDLEARPAPRRARAAAGCG